jgi:hypothetical protein
MNGEITTNGEGRPRADIAATVELAIRQGRACEMEREQLLRSLSENAEDRGRAALEFYTEVVTVYQDA